MAKYHNLKVEKMNLNQRKTLVRLETKYRKLSEIVTNLQREFGKMRLWIYLGPKKQTLMAMCVRDKKISVIK